MAAALALATLVVLPRPSSAAPAVSYQAVLGQLESPSLVVADAAATTGRAVQFNAPTPDAAGFVHPGILLDPSQLSFVANQIAASGAPWTGALAALNPAYTNVNYVAHPAATVDCSANASSCQSVLNDAIAAYTQALLYSYSTAPDRAKYANASISIMNAWSATLTKANGNSARLNLAWAAEVFPRAAEIVRYTFTPGPTDRVLNVTAFTNMLNNVFEPTIVAGDANSNGNWELAMADGLVSIGVFTDNRGVFNAGLAMWRARVPAYIYLSTDDGGSGRPLQPPGGLYNNPTALTCYWLGAGAVSHPCTVPTGFRYYDGMTQETCRDLSHPIIGLESIVNAAETARLQGVDLYGEQKQRIASAFEYAAAYDSQYLTNHAWPAIPCGGQPGSFSGQGGDGTGGTGYTYGWEIGYNEFANRLGLPMPNTQAMIARFRPTGGVNATVWETLANAGPAAPGGCTAPDLRSGAATLSINVDVDASYRLWARIKPTANTATSLNVQVDSGCPITVGGAAHPAGEWSWVDEGATAPVDLNLTAGTHALSLTGRSSGLAVDSVMVLANHRCVPVDLGANCATSDNTPPVDAAPPTTTLTAPADGATIAGTVDMTADADDDIAVTRVDFLVGDTVIGSATSAPYTFSWDSSTVPDGTYLLESKAYDAVGNATASTPVSVAVLNADSVPPDAPTGVLATASSASSIGVTWTAAHDNIAVKRYLIDRDGVQIGTTTATSYSDTGLSDITDYTYTVYSVDAAGNVSDVSASSTATTPDGTPPTAPTAVLAVATAQDTVSISWTASSDNVGVVGYIVQRNGVIAGTTTSGLTLTDAGVAAGTAFSYTVQAVDGASNESAPSLVATVTTPDTTAPTTPTALHSTAATATSVTLTWTASTDNVAVTRYLVFRGGVQVGTSATASFVDAGLTAKTSYTYVVYAQDAALNTSQVSNSAVVTTPTAADTTPPSAPASITATITAFNQISLSWGTATDNVAVSAYRLSRGGVQLQQSATRTFTDSGLASATSYTYSVVAIDAAGNVGPAKSVTAATPASAAPAGAGWAGAYYNNTTLSGGAIGRLDPTINFSWGSGAPMAGINADNFSARWSGQVTPTKSGSYTFTTTTSGGVRLWVNDVLVLDHWTVGSATHTATVSFTAGVATNLRMEYFVTTGSASAQLFWTGPSIAKTVIPSSVMTSASTGLTGTYVTGTALTAPPTMLRLDRTLNFDWGTGSPDSRLPVDNFAVRWTGKIKPTSSASYTFYTDTAGGVRLWVNGQLLVDNWGLHSLTTNSAKITLTAGTSSDIRVEYQEGTGTASAKLSWSTSSFGKTIVPQSVLRDR